MGEKEARVRCATKCFLLHFVLFLGRWKDGSIFLFTVGCLVTRTRRLRGGLFLLLESEFFLLFRLILLFGFRCSRVVT